MNHITINLSKIISAPLGSIERVKIDTKIASPDKENIKIISRLTGFVVLSNLKKEISIDLSLKITLKLTCFRCGEKYPKITKIYNKKILKTSKIKNKKINILPQINEEIILSVPVKPLCKKSCKGRCPLCGQNFNKDKCNCKIQKISKNKPLINLKNILERKENGRAKKEINQKK